MAMRNDAIGRARESLIYVLPLLLFVVVFILVPVLGTGVTSVFKDIAFLEKRFALFDNYRTLLYDPSFYQSLRFTLLFIAVSVPVEIVLGLVFALILNHPLPVRGVLRACLLVPWAIPAAVSARTWELIYNYSYGLANVMLTKLKLTGEPVNWLGTEGGAFFSIVVADVWKTTPFAAIIILAGLQAIPEDLYGQARVDGANAWQRFSKVTLPLIKPVLVVALLFRTIDALRVFDLVYVLTRGGPGGATTSLSMYGYRYFVLGDFGYGSAVSVVLFLLALGLSIAYVRLSRWRTAIM